MGKMPTKLRTMDTERRNDIVNVLIIIGVALVLGFYLIATTVVISKDGTGYIELARQFSTDLAGNLKTEHPGYLLLISAAHRLASVFTKDSSVFIWIYSAQCITLLFQLLALIPLYFIGKRLIGGKNSFYAVMILIVLPNPAKLSCEVVREWPYMFFLAAGFLFLLWGAGKGTPWIFGLAGLSCGLGYWIRSESGQIVLYGLAWLTLSILRPSVGKMARHKSLAASVLLLISFASLVLPYVKYTGNIISPNTERIIRLLSDGSQPDKAVIPCDETGTTNLYAAGLAWGGVPDALGEIFKAIGENLMWFFMPFLFAGFIFRMRYSAGFEERFLLSIFIVMNLTMMVARYCHIEPHISSRWTLPLVAFTIFYIPAGLQIAAQWIGKKCVSGLAQNFNLYLILFLAGIASCLPKLLRPAGYEKSGFRAAAKWLNENTNPGDNVTIPDNRIIFYADRQKPSTANNNGTDPAVYVVRIIKEGTPDFAESVQNEAADIRENNDTASSDWMKRFSLKGLIGYWPATLNAEDYSGHSNQGTLCGKAGYAAGKFGQAFALNPVTGDYIDCGNAPGLNPESLVSLSAWIYPTTASKGSILSKNGPYFMEMMADCKIRAGVYAGAPPSWTIVTGNSSLSLNSWHHVVMTYDGSHVRIFVDGTVDGSPSATSGKLLPTTVHLCLGYGQEPFDNYFCGLIDEVMIFGRALAGEEIDVLYDEKVGYWKDKIVYSLWIEPRKKNRKLIILKIT